MAKNNITIVGASVGLGYHPAGPAHEPTEDLAYMRSLCGLEIHSPCNNHMTKALVDLSYRDSKLRYVRLERTQPKGFEDLYTSSNDSFIENGIFNIKTTHNKSNKNIMILSSGYMLEKADKLYQKMLSNNYNVALTDIWKLPIDYKTFESNTDNYDTLITIEEQSLNGGFGSSVCEIVCDMDLNKQVIRIGLPNKYIFDNGSRDYVLENNGFDLESMYNSIIRRLK